MHRKGFTCTYLCYAISTLEIKEKEMRLMKKDVFNSMKDIIQGEISKEGMSQYLLLISTEDILFSQDLITISLLNSSYHGLDPLTYNDVMFEAVDLLNKGTESKLMYTEISDGSIKFRPIIKNEFKTTEEFFLFSKKQPGFILRDIYLKYLNGTHVAKMANDLFLNPNASGLLRTDSNYIVYDDTCDISLKILSFFTRVFHSEKFIPKSKLINFIAEAVIDRESIIDFITYDLQETLETTSKQACDALLEKARRGLVNLNELEYRFKTASVVSSNTWYNIQYLNSKERSSLPGFSIGVSNLFDRELTTGY